MAVDNAMFPPLARRYFNSCFQKIKQFLSLDFEDDATARAVIDMALVKEHAQVTARRHEWIGDQVARKEQPCLIIAPGPTLENVFDEIFDSPGVEISGYYAIDIDGAARRFIDKSKEVNAVVTDLDGLNMDQIIELHDNFLATIIIHGHGNNVDKLQAFFNNVPVDERYVFTTQIEPTRRVANLGGFTDGDRAIFAAIALGFKHLLLLAMDLDAGQIGHYSKPEYAAIADDELILSQHPIKEKKIKIALESLKWIMKHKPADCDIVTLCKSPPFEFMPNQAGV